MRHRHPFGPTLGQTPYSGPDRTVEALTRLPHDGGPQIRGPARDLLVITDHRDGHRERRPPPHGWPWSGRAGPALTSGSAVPRRRLAWWKALTGTRTTSGPSAAVGIAHSDAAAVVLDTVSVYGPSTGRPRRRLFPCATGWRVGAGSWGTAVASIVGASHPTSLWVRSPELAATSGARCQRDVPAWHHVASRPAGDLVARPKRSRMSRSSSWRSLARVPGRPDRDGADDRRGRGGGKSVQGD